MARTAARTANLRLLRHLIAALFHSLSLLEAALGLHGLNFMLIGHLFQKLDLFLSEICLLCIFLTFLLFTNSRHKIILASRSASTPPSSVSISGAAQKPIESGPSSLESPRGPDVQHKSEVRQENFVPITGSMVWSWKSPGKRKPERAIMSEKSDVLPPLPQKSHNQMTRLES